MAATSMKALVVQANGTATVKDVPVPTISDDQILVKTVAIALNPTDGQHIDTFTKAGMIAGVDWSGTVVQVGKNAGKFTVGDHVAGFVHGGMFEGEGAFAEYVRADADLAWVVPAGTLSHEQTATMGCAFWTAAQGLFHPKRLGLVEPPNKTPSGESVFVHGGSSSLGLFVIELAHLAGYNVVTVASPKNHELCLSYGASAVFDYKDPEVVSKVKAATGDNIHIAYDAIGLPATQVLTAKIMGPGPGKIVVIKFPLEEAQKVREDVTMLYTIVYSVFGRDFVIRKTFPACAEDRAHMAQFLTKLPALVSSGAVRANPVTLMPGGLAEIPEGLQIIKEGKNSGEKLVYRV